MERAEREYNAKKEKMLLESQSRKWYSDLAYTVFWYIVVILMIAIYRVIRMYLIMVLYLSFDSPLLFAYYLELFFF